jgi:hypothetical protein
MVDHAGTGIRRCGMASRASFKAPSRPVPGVVVVLMVLVGIGLAWLLYGMVGAQIGFERRALVAEGRVVALRERPSSGRLQTTVYAPVFRFVTADGRTIEAVGEDGSNPPVWTVGETGRLLYDPAAPAHATAATLRGRWGASLLLGVVTLSFFAGATLGLRTRGWRLTPPYRSGTRCPSA